jgi:hypothetical protein
MFVVIDASLFVYLRFGFSPEENSCVVSLNARLIESYVCSTTYDKRQVSIVLPNGCFFGHGNGVMFSIQ